MQRTNPQQRMIWPKMSTVMRLRNLTLQLKLSTTVLNLGKDHLWYKDRGRKTITCQLQAVINYRIKEIYVSCCNTLQLWLRTTEVYSFTVLKPRSPKPVLLGKSQGDGSGGSRGESVPCCFWLLVAASIGTPWLVATSRIIYTHFKILDHIFKDSFCQIK